MLLIVRCFISNKRLTYLMYEVISMITEKFGERIKDLRNTQGISQEKFALSIEMDRTYYASVESGKRNISLRNIEKIANGLGVSLEELFKGV